MTKVNVVRAGPKRGPSLTLIHFARSHKASATEVIFVGDVAHVSEVFKALTFQRYPRDQSCMDNQRSFGWNTDGIRELLQEREVILIQQKQPVVSEQTKNDAQLIK